MLTSFTGIRRMFNPTLRAFNTKQVDSFDGHTPPIRDDSLAGRYATVLFQQASKNKVLSRILEDVEFLKDLHS